MPTVGETLRQQADLGRFEFTRTFAPETKSPSPFPFAYPRHGTPIEIANWEKTYQVWWENKYCPFIPTEWIGLKNIPIPDDNKLNSVQREAILTHYNFSNVLNFIAKEEPSLGETELILTHPKLGIESIKDLFPAGKKEREKPLQTEMVEGSKLLQDVFLKYFFAKFVRINICGTQNQEQQANVKISSPSQIFLKNINSLINERISSDSYGVVQSRQRKSSILWMSTIPTAEFFLLGYFNLNPSIKDQLTSNYKNRCIKIRNYLRIVYPDLYQERFPKYEAQTSDLK